MRASPRDRREMPPGDGQVKAQSSWDFTEGCTFNMGKTTFVYVDVKFGGFLTN